MGAAAGRSQRPQPLRRPGGRRGGSSAIQGAPRGSVAVALGSRRLPKTLLDPSRDAQGRVTEPRDPATRAARFSGSPRSGQRLAWCSALARPRLSSELRPGPRCRLPEALLRHLRRPRRLTAHLSGRRVSLSFPAPPTQRLFVHWPVACSPTFIG